jgi:hypothetical protein
MAIGKKAGGNKPVLASLRPDNMASAGLADDFDGTITKARFVPWTYGGAVADPILAAAVHITPDEDSGLEPFIQYYSAGDLEHFVPADEDGDAVDIEGWSGNDEDIETVEGVSALKIGKRDQLNNNSNFAHMLGALVDAGFDQDEMSGDIRFLEGLYGHFNRVPQKKRSGIVVNPGADGETRQRTILVVTELKESKANGKATAANTGKVAAKGKGAGAGTTGTKAAAGKGKAAAAAAGDDNDGDDFDTRLESVVADALAENDGTLPKSKLSSYVIKKFEGKEKALAVKRVGSAEFLEAATRFVFDSDSGDVTSVE